MAVPNLAPGYLAQRKSAADQVAENQRQRDFERSQASSNFLRTMGRDVLGTALGIGADIAGSAFRDSLTKDERAAAAGTFYPDDDVMGDNSAAIRKVAEARALTELRPQASFGGAAETGIGKRGIDTNISHLGGAKADVLRPAGPPSVTPGVTPLVTQLRASEPVKRPEYATAFDAPGLAPRGMEQEAPRRPLPAPQSAPMAQPRPMAPQGTREAPGGYMPPRMMPSATAAMARETGYRDAIPSMPTSVRGLAQQAQDVRDERALNLELMRKKLLWDEQQATANVERLKAQGASATAIAKAKQQEADQKGKTEVFRQLYLGTQAQNEGGPRYVKGLGVTATPQTVKLYGDTENGLAAQVVGRGALPQRSGGSRGGQGGPGAGEEPTGDVLTLVVQTRDRRGNPVGPSQPRRLQEGPALWRAVATSPVDYGMNAAQAAQYKEAFRAFNAALPAARKGDATALQEALKAQDAMRSSLMAGQAVYAPEVAATREGFGTSPKDVATEQIRNDLALLRQQIADQDKASGRTRRVGNLFQEIAPLADEARVTADDIAATVMDAGAALPGQKGRFVTPDGAELDRDAFEAAVRGLPMPASVDAEDAPSFKRLSDEAKKARDQLTTQRESLRARRIEALALQMEAEGDPDPLSTMERSGVVLPASLKEKKARTVILPPTPAPARPQAPTPARPQAPDSQPSAVEREPRFNTAQEASDWVRKKPWPADVKRSTLMAILREQGLTPPAGQ